MKNVNNNFEECVDEVHMGAHSVHCLSKNMTARILTAIMGVL